MVKLPLERMAQMEKRFLMIEHQMALEPNGEEYVKLASDYAYLEPIIVKIRELNKANQEIENLAQLIVDADIQMQQLIKEEQLVLEKRIEDLEQELQILLLPKDIADDKSVILEIRAGTGGSEAALFSGDLFRMYERYATTKGWKVELVSSSEGEMGGYKEIIAAIEGKGVFAKLKFECGVHRVQRIPQTETNGRVHTSAATIAVLPEAEDIDINIRNEDIRIDTMRASGAGGQHVNTTDSAVRITHIPTGITVALQDEKSQHKNKAKALKILRARIYEEERRKKDQERANNRREQIGSGDRSERIRTYNFPQGRVSDHRINLTLYKIDEVINGQLDEFIEALIANDEAKKLSDI